MADFIGYPRGKGAGRLRPAVRRGAGRRGARSVAGVEGTSRRSSGSTARSSGSTSGPSGRRRRTSGRPLR